MPSWKAGVAAAMAPDTNHVLVTFRMEERG